jgi:acetyl-CoA carboxylase biotin carboxyl carrier protein
VELPVINNVPSDEAEEKEKGTAKPEAEKEASSNNYHEISAPLVGTFYTASSPDADPFVEVGDKVKVGDTLCIVEAMKNMNEIECDAEGVVKEILVKNAELVEFGQVLIRIQEIGNHHDIKNSYC